MVEFPASEFHVDGEPSAIRASAGRWSAFGTAATEAATQIRSLDSSLFVGPEGDQYRAGLNQNLPPHLETTGHAYTAVGTTLTTYATTLTGLQDRMSPLRVKAPALWEALQQAHGRVTAAHSADRQHQRQVTDAQGSAGDDQPDRGAADAYQSDLDAARTSLNTAEHAWNECLRAARAITTDLRAAIDTTTRAIREAADLRFAHNPHGLVSGFKDFVTDHAEGLSQLSGALKIVSGIAAILSVIPVVGEVALAVSLVTAGAALLIDANIKYATGKGSWTSIAIDGALLALPFGIGKAADAFRGARAAERLAAGATEPGAQVGAVTTETRSSLFAGAARAEQHLSRIDHSPANDAMLARIRSAAATGNPLHESESNFLRHELTEADLMDGGMSYDDAHALAGRTHPTFGNYHPDVIDQFPELFNNNWRAHWGLAPR